MRHILSLFYYYSIGELSYNPITYGLRDIAGTGIQVFDLKPQRFINGMNLTITEVFRANNKMGFKEIIVTGCSKMV